MHVPLLSFLTTFEQALAAQDPSPAAGGVWACERSVNYGDGLARLSISIREPERMTPRGHLVLNGYRLGDGTFCLKATLHWTNAEETRVRSIYPQPNSDWKLESQRTAEDWLAGPRLVARDPQ